MLTTDPTTFPWFWGFVVAGLLLLLLLLLWLWLSLSIIVVAVVVVVVVVVAAFAAAVALARLFLRLTFCCFGLQNRPWAIFVQSKVATESIWCGCKLLLTGQHVG